MTIEVSPKVQGDLKPWIFTAHLALIASAVFAPLLLAAMLIPWILRTDSRGTVWESHVEHALRTVVLMTGVVIVGLLFSSQVMADQSLVERMPLLVGSLVVLLIVAVVFVVGRSAKALMLASRGMPV